MAQTRNYLLGCHFFLDRFLCARIKLKYHLWCKRIHCKNSGIECGEVGEVLPPNLRVTVISREVGGQAVFTCSTGHGLRGPQQTICLPSGDWSTPYPTCEGRPQCFSTAADGSDVRKMLTAKFLCALFNWNAIGLECIRWMFVGF